MHMQKQRRCQIVPLFIIDFPNIAKFSEIKYYRFSLSNINTLTINDFLISEVEFKYFHTDVFRFDRIYQTLLELARQLCSTAISDSIDPLSLVFPPSATVNKRLFTTYLNNFKPLPFFFFISNTNYFCTILEITTFNEQDV